MPDPFSSPGPTPTNYQRTTGGNLQWQPPTPEHLQEMLPAYEVLNLLGQGGMGAVYKGRQRSLDRFVAIKILPPEAAEQDMQFVERFQNEARTMAKMNHPSIVHVYDFGETREGQLYIVMEFIDGTDVAQMILSQGKLPQDYALSITAHVCDALGYAHAHGVVHRDIKPANVLINMEGHVKVADFGLAKATDPSQMGLTKTNVAMGTPDFVSPEAMMPGVPLDGRADLYAVGVMLYNMLTGTIPRGAFRMPSTTLKTDTRFDQIILKAMEMDRENRYQTAHDLRCDLDVILTTPVANVEVQTLPAQEAAPPQKPMGKSPGAPHQQKPATNAGKPGSPVPAAAPGKKAGMPVTAAAKKAKSNPALIYGIPAAVVVVAACALLYSGGSTKPSPAPKAVAAVVTKPESEKPESKPATPPPAFAPKPTPAPAAVATGKEPWVDGLAQWFGGTKTNNDFVREGNGARVGAALWSVLAPIPPSAPPLRDQVVRARWRGLSDKADFRLFLRNTADAANKEARYTAVVKLSRGEVWEMRLTGPGMVLGNRDWALPTGFKIDATHTTEFRIIGDLLSASLDGKKIAEVRDSQLTSGYPALSGTQVLIESFEYANLDPGASAPAPAVATVKPGKVLTFVGHRYQLVREPLNWEQSKAMAASMGGHLATVTSREEKEWLSKNIALPEGDDQHVRLGASKSPKAGNSWVWVTGEPVDMALWGGNGPDGSGDSLCYYGPSRPWDDVFSSNPRPFLVEWDDESPVMSPVLTQPLAVSAAAAAARKGMDLLPLVDVKRDTIKGEWLLKPEGLVSVKDMGFPILEMKQATPVEYDFEIEFTVVGGTREVSQVLAVPGGIVFWQMGYGAAGEETPFCFGPILDGKKPGDRTEASVKRARLKSGQRYRSVVEVRKDSLRALLDGEVVLQWSGDFKRFVNPPDYCTFQDNRHVGLAAYRSEVLFHKAELRPPGDAALPVPAAPADSRLAQLAAGFKARHEADALQPFKTALAALNTSYLTNGVARARMAAKAKGILAEVTALDAEKTAIEEGRSVPDEDEAGTPESLKTLRGTYRTAHAKLAAERDVKAAPLYDLYLKTLDAYIAELTQADKIAAARKVQVFRDDIALSKPAAAPTAARQATTLMAPASSLPTKPAVRAAKMNEHELAEWAIATGGFVNVSFGTPVVSKRIAIASELPRGRFTITLLRILCDKVPDNDLSPLASAQEVEDVFLDNTMLANQPCIDLTPLRQIPKLGRLTTRDLDAAAVDVIASLDAIHSLYVGSLPEGSLEKIAKLKQLVTLESTSIIGPGIAALKNCKQLRSIMNATNPNVSDEDVRALVAALPDLTELTIRGDTAITQACIPSLLSLRSLSKLTLRGQKIDDSVMEPLSKLPNLIVLRLHSSKIIGSNLGVLLKVHSLRELYLDECSVTDEALEVLVQMKGLTKLQCRDTKVTDAGIEKFKAARPGFNVSR